MLLDAQVPAEDRAFRKPRARPRRADLTLGVFPHDGGWKVYGQFDAPVAYASREAALAAAQARAAQAMRAGRRVELFLQDEDGTFSQAAVELH